MCASVHPHPSELGTFMAHGLAFPSAGVRHNCPIGFCRHDRVFGNERHPSFLVSCPASLTEYGTK
jgi:hypothetical protein